MKICFRNIGIIVVHDFGNDITEVEPLSKKLKMLGYIVETPLLTGHTGSKKDMKKVTYQDWVNDIENTYLSLKDKCQEIVLIGFSMGGLLSLQIANKFKVKGLITLNTPLFIGNFIKELIKDLIHLKLYNFKKIFTSIRRLPLKAYFNFNRLLKETKKILPGIKCDIIVNQANHDEVIRYKSAHFLHNNIQSKNKKMMLYKKSKRLSYQSEIAEDVIVDLVKYIESN